MRPLQQPFRCLIGPSLFAICFLPGCGGKLDDTPGTPIPVPAIQVETVSVNEISANETATNSEPPTAVNGSIETAPTGDHSVKTTAVGENPEPAKDDGPLLIAQADVSASSKDKNVPNAKPKKPAGKIPGWPSFRNGFQLRGLADSQLPEKLELLWKVASPDGYTSTAAIVEGRVYAGTYSGDLLCLDLKTGEKLWSYRSIDDPDPKAFAPAFKASPTITQDAVLLGDEDGVFHAVNRSDGKRKWLFKTDAEIISSASVVGEKVIFGSYDNNLYCLNAANGKKIWSVMTDGYVNCSPAISGDFTFVTGCDEHLRIINIETGKQENDIPLETYLIASPANLGDVLYFGTYASEVIAINWKTEEVLWRYKDPAKEFPYHSSAAVTDDYVVVGGHDKQMHCINRKTGDSVWVFPTRGRIESSPVVLGQRVFFGSSDQNIYEVNLKDGKEKWKFNAGGDVTASPAIADGCLVIGAEGNDAFLYCFGEKKDK